MNNARKKSVIPGGSFLSLFYLLLPLNANAWYDYSDYSSHGYSGHSRHRVSSYQKPYRSYNCEKVSKISYQHGQKTRVAGTRCYNRHGEAYIVPGSRYVISYY